jgi:hypothetical protein
MSGALVEVHAEETPQLGWDAPAVVQVSEVPTRTEVAPEVMELVKVESRIAPAADSLEPENRCAD